ncbi:MAG: DUF1835 domain-containing protein [Mucilaginibacter sp.]
MSNILHILNGDDTAISFEQTGLEGDTLVWREVLSQGPLGENITSSAFWNARSAWIAKAFNEAPDDYREKVIKPLEKLSEHYDEINLWFEFDLHCQANLLGVMALLNKKTDLSAPAIYLVCPEEYPGIVDFRGMGQLNSEQLEDLYDDRMRLNEWEFTLAAQAWKLFASRDDKALEKWLDENTFWGNLPSLKSALLAYIGLIRTNKNGLNTIEQKLLDIYKSGIKTRQEIYAAFWESGKIYGMGDLEIDLYLTTLADNKLITL